MVNFVLFKSISGEVDIYQSNNSHTRVECLPRMCKIMALLCIALAKPHDNMHQNFSRYAKGWQENNGDHGRTLFYVRIQPQHTHGESGGMGFIM